MDEEEIPTPPDVLRDRGAGFWRELNGRLRLDEKQLSILFEACRSLDTIEGLAAAVESDGLMITGSQGQQVLHPAVTEIRQQQVTFARLVAQMNLPEDEKARDLFRFRRAQAGASARWNRPTGAALPPQQRRMRAVPAGDDWLSKVTVVDDEPGSARERWAAMQEGTG